MPYRNSGAYASQQYAAFADPNGFNFTYDVGSDNLMSPYAFPLMSPDASCQYTPLALTPPPNSAAAIMNLVSSTPSPPQYSYSLAGTPASQQFTASNQSDSLSPLEIGSFTTPPQDQDIQCPSSAGALVQSDENPAIAVAAAARRSHLDQQQVPAPMANPDALFHGQKRNASFLGPDSPVISNMNPLVSAGIQQQPSASSSTSPPAIPIKSRQSSTDGSPEGIPDDAVQAPETAAAARVRTTDSAKVRHNIVERRYRENINAQVDLLRESIVATVHSKEEQQGVSASRLGADELKRLTKAAVIAAATKQIRRARTENERLLDEHRSLQAQVQELESLVKCGDCPLMKLTVDLSLESPTQPP